MDDKHERGPAFRRWRKKQGLRVEDVAPQIGDPTGWTLRKFESGSRDLPISVAPRLADTTGYPLRKILSAEQMRTAKIIFAVMARDAAA